MAYMSQQKKSELAPAIKAILKKYGISGSIAVRNMSTLVVNIKSGPIDFIANANDCEKVRADRQGYEFQPFNSYISVNTYWYKEHFAGIALEFLSELIPAMMKGNHNNSDVQTDYFDVGWYIDVNIGQWDKPYKLSLN